jgi:hypothetical protein
MSALWSQTPTTIRLDDLDVICRARLRRRHVLREPTRSPPAAPKLNRPRPDGRRWSRGSDPRIEPPL